jgi:hypothetical protein
MFVSLLSRRLSEKEELYRQSEPNKGEMDADCGKTSVKQRVSSSFLLSRLTTGASKPALLN